MQQHNARQCYGSKSTWGGLSQATFILHWGVTKSTSLSPEHCDWTQPHKSPSSEVRILCQVELLHQLLREAVNPHPRQNFERKITSKTFHPESDEKCRLMSMRVHWLQGVELHWSSSSINAGQNITSAGLGNKMLSSSFPLYRHIKPKHT